MRFKEKQASIEAESWVKWWEMIGCTGAERNCKSKQDGRMEKMSRLAVSPDINDCMCIFDK